MEKTQKQTATIQELEDAADLIFNADIWLSNGRICGGRLHYG